MTCKVCALGAPRQVIIMELVEDGLERVEVRTLRSKDDGHPSDGKGYTSVVTYHKIGERE